MSSTLRLPGRLPGRLAGATALALVLAAGAASAQGNGPGMMGPAGSPEPSATAAPNPDQARPPAPPWAGYGPGPWMMGGGWMGPEAAGYGPGPWMMGGGYGPGPWMMGGGYGPGPWAMGSGWLGPEMMGRFSPGPWISGGAGFGPWMMGPWMMRQGAVGWGGDGSCAGWGPAQRVDLNLNVDQVKTGMERFVGALRNPHVKLGAVTAKGPDTITADIVTTDNGGLVQRYEIDRRTGFIEPEGD